MPRKEPRISLPEGDDLDAELAAVDPRHWPETRRRVEALRSYMLLEVPTVAAAERAADAVGVRPNRLYQLVRRLRDTGGDLATLTPHGTRPRTTRLATETSGLLDVAIDQTLARDPAALPDHALGDVRRLFAARGLKPPSRPTVRLRFQRRAEERSLQGSSATAGAGQDGRDGHRLVIDRAALGVPVVQAFAATLPLVTLAIDPATGKVAAMRETPDEEPFRRSVALVLADALKAMAEGGIPWPRTVEVDRDADPRWRALSDALLAGGLKLEARRAPRPGNGRRVRRLVGPSLAALPLITHCLAPSGSERYLRWRSVPGRTIEPVTPSTATTIVRAAVQLHNASRVAAAPTTGPAIDNGRLAVITTLRRIAADG